MKGRWKLAIAVLAVTAAAVATAGALAETSVKDYVVTVGDEYELDALFSVNDKVPEASNAGLFYRMVGIPDGLGAMPNGDGTSTLYMNHELGYPVTSSPVVDAAGNPLGPAYRGAVVSKWTLDRTETRSRMSEPTTRSGTRHVSRARPGRVERRPGAAAVRAFLLGLAGREGGGLRPTDLLCRRRGRSGRVVRRSRWRTTRTRSSQPAATSPSARTTSTPAPTQYLMINEDGTGASRPVMASKGRDGSIWRLNFVTKRKPGRPIGVRASTATRIAELDPPGRDGAAVGPGTWETSGIIDASALFGAN